MYFAMNIVICMKTQTHTPHITAHADARMNQRGITRNVMDLVIAHGDPRGDKIVLSRKRASKLIREYKQALQDLQAVEKKGGVTAIMAGNTLITSYRTASYVRPTQRRVKG